MVWRSARLGAAALVVVGTSTAASAQVAERIAVFRFVPTQRAQIAIWIESQDGSRFATVRLTDATCRRGIGNRPGASQMNSGWHWPYGRREGVLPVWAHRRAAAPGATLFARVIFQNRPEGWASRIVEDSSPDQYYCLSFNAESSRRDGLDAISCPSRFNSDKGRFMTATDAGNGYSEPIEEAGTGMLRRLDATSLYPPRSDVVRCTGTACLDSADVSMYAAEARRVLPDLDAISMATPAGDLPSAIAFSIPSDWPDGDYFAYLEINTEGDYNASHNDTLYPTPSKPMDAWDSWAQAYGYPYRGQPSVVFRVAIRLGTTDGASTREAFGIGSLTGHGPQGGQIRAIDAAITDDPTMAPGSGIDRLRITPEGYRLRVDLGPIVSDGGASSDASGASDGMVGTDASVTTDGGVGDAPGSSEPLCVPGRTLTCACLGGGTGAQTCSDDGQRFGICDCLPSSSRSGCGCQVDGSTESPLGPVLFFLLLSTAALTRECSRQKRRPCADRYSG